MIKSFHFPFSRFPIRSRRSKKGLHRDVDEKRKDTYIENYNTPLALILDEEIGERQIRRFLRGANWKPGKHNGILGKNTYLVRAHRVATPDVMGRPQSRHVHGVGRDIQQRANCRANEHSHDKPVPT